MKHFEVVRQWCKKMEIKIFDKWLISLDHVMSAKVSLTDEDPTLRKKLWYIWLVGFKIDDLCIIIHSNTNCAGYYIVFILSIIHTGFFTISKSNFHSISLITWYVIFRSLYLFLFTYISHSWFYALCNIT